MSPALLGETLQTVPTYRPKTIDYWQAGGMAVTAGSIGALAGAALSKKKNDKGAVFGAIAGSALGLGVVVPNLTAYRCGNNVDHPDNNGRVPAYDPNLIDFGVIAAGAAVPGWIGMKLAGGYSKQSNGKAAAIGALAGASLLAAFANTAMLGLQCGSWKSAPGSTI